MKRTHVGLGLLSGGVFLAACQTVVTSLPQSAVTTAPTLSRTLVFLEVRVSDAREHEYRSSVNAQIGEREAAEGPLRVGRATIEADLANRLASIGATPSSAVLGDTIQPPRATVQELATRAGFDAILILSLESLGESRSPDVGFVSEPRELRDPPDLRAPTFVPGATSHVAMFRASLWDLPRCRELWSAQITHFNADLAMGDFRAVDRSIATQLRAAGVLR